MTIDRARYRPAGLVSVGLVLGAALAAGCMSSARAGETLPESLRTYHEGGRWGRYAAAAGRVPAAERADFVAEREELAEDLRLTDYEVMAVTPAGADRARVRIKYTWYLDSVGTVHDTWAEQAWEHQGKLWLLVDERWVRGPAMPGVAGQEEAPAEGAAAEAAPVAGGAPGLGVPAAGGAGSSGPAAL